MGWSFFSKKERSLGVDFGTSSIKIVQLVREEEFIRLETYGEIRADQVSDNSPQPTISLEEQELSEMLKRVMETAKARPENVNVSVPIFSSFVTTIEMPVMTEEELAQAIPFQARRYVPVPIEEVVLDWAVSKPVKTENNNEVLNVLLVAIPNELIQRHSRVAKSAGLAVTALEMETFALARAVIGEEKLPTCLVDVGAHSTDMAVVESGVIRVAHNFDIAGNYLSQNIAKSLNVPLARAEVLKQSLKTADIESAASLKEILVPFFDLLISEINRMISDYTTVTSKKVEQLILSGGASLQSTLASYLAGKLGVPVSLANPFRNIRYPSALTPIIKRIGPSYAVAVGLAMRQFVKSQDFNR